MIDNIEIAKLPSCLEENSGLNINFIKKEHRICIHQSFRKTYK